MAFTIKASTDEMRFIADRWQKDADSLEKTMHSIHNTVDSLDSIWAGETANAFKQEFNIDYQHINRLIRLLRESSETLLEISDIYEQAEYNSILQSNTPNPEDIV